MKLTNETLRRISLPISRETYCQLRDCQIPIEHWPKRLIAEYVRWQDKVSEELWEQSPQLGTEAL